MKEPGNLLVNNENAKRIIVPGQYSILDEIKIKYFFPLAASACILSDRPVGKKPSETQDKPHFQRHSLPGPDFWAEKGKNGIFSLKPL